MASRIVSSVHCKAEKADHTNWRLSSCWIFGTVSFISYIEDLEMVENFE
jgi:hypothetical protein